MSLPRLRRAAVLTLAGLAFSLASASPALAADTVAVKMNGGVLSVVGTPAGDSITVEQPGGLGTPTTVTVAGVNATAGSGCSQVTSIKVTCAETFQIGVTGGSGDDRIRVTTKSDNPTPGILSGNLGNDTIFGGAGRDQIRGADGDDTLRGGGGIDSADGGNGQDACTAETESRCET